MKVSSGVEKIDNSKNVFEISSVTIVFKSEDGNTFYFHNGGTSGYTSFLCIDTDRKLGMVILTNGSGFHPKMTDIDKMGFALMKELGQE